MSENIDNRILNVMAAGLSKREIRGLKKIFLNPTRTQRHYRLNQWKELGKIDIVLIGPDDTRVLKKWRELNESRDDCPHAIYICDKDSKVDDLEILLSACYRPVKKSKIIELLDQAPAIKKLNVDPENPNKQMDRHSQPLAA